VIDQFGQVIDVLASEKRVWLPRRFFTRALGHGTRPTEVSTDRAPAYLRGLDKMPPTARHVGEPYGKSDQNRSRR
jgi:transposase-like protein